MNEKTLFSVFLPATGRSYELWIPDELAVFEATQLVSRILSNSASDFFAASAATALYDKSNGTELEMDRLMVDYGYVNGSELILV
ncbi:MAG: hypothetical protein LBS58_01220 [Coriobacteriales bacterium]|jgi:hypothetical protein|nr:hypothetical protein [Coriobacteriales bacterium]